MAQARELVALASRPGRVASRVWIRPGPCFVAPAVATLLAVLALPMAVVIGNSVGVSASGAEPTLQHFRRLIQDEIFWNAFGNTVIFTVGSVALHGVVGLPVALLLNQRVPGRKFFRVVTMLPWMLSSVVVAVTWRWLYDAQFGVVNDLLRRMGVLNRQIDILGEPAWAMPAVMLANLWRGFPFITIIVLAALQAIPQEQYDAAAVDGASGWRVFRFVTFPNILYPLVVTATLDALFNFRYFDLIQVMTAGGPAGRTEVLTTLVYRSAFETFDTGYASAMAVLMFLVVLAFSIIYTRRVL